ncbi:MAG: pilin [Candidatus Andersenbacteria bacterium]
MAKTDFFQSGLDDAAKVDATLAKLAGEKDIEITLLTRIIDWLLGISAVLALLALIVGGVMYIISFGDEKRTGTAKKIILTAIIGLVIVGTSFLIIEIVKRLLLGEGGE